MLSSHSFPTDSEHAPDGYHVSIIVRVPTYIIEHNERVRGLCEDISNTLFSVRDSVHYNFPYGGCSGCFVLAESHLNYHTYPERELAIFDIYYCNKMIDPNHVLSVFNEKFEPIEIRFDVRARDFSDI